MENTVSRWRDLDDLIFEQRNKAYGAYSLRKAYGNNMRKAAYVGLGIFFLVLFSPKIWASLKGNNSNFDGTVVNIMTPPPAKKKEESFIPPPPPPKKVPPPPVATIAFKPPKVTNQEDIKDVDVPKMEDIKVAVSTETREGVKGDLPPIATEAAPPPPEPKEEKKEEDIDKVESILTVQQQPEFKDGVVAMYQFLSENIVYPAVARENGIEGTVFVSFIVGKDGAIRDVQLKRGIGGGCSEEALRVVKLMPNWNPGKQNGKAVSVTFTMPVKFKLE
jgi:periplasmic protein TonB